ncbi:MAG: hypothetical protein OXK74_16240, partial [Gemmatimonadota bacterium]|nr:hypothetical protein [Gemmatimonadota bacterium]
MAHAGRAATASRSAVESVPRPGFRSSIRREDVEFLGRKPETGGTPPPLRGSSSCVTGDPTASDSTKRPP